MRSLGWIVVSLLPLVAPAAEAARVTWTLQGLTSGATAEGNSLGLVDGNPYTLRITFESSTPPRFDQYIYWDNAVLAVTLDSGDYHYAMPLGETRGFIAGPSYFGTGGPAGLFVFEPPYFTQLPIAPWTSTASLWLVPGLPSFTAGTLTLTSVPEPAPAWLISGALVFLLRAARTRSTGLPLRAQPF